MRWITLATDSIDSKQKIKNIMYNFMPINLTSWKKWGGFLKTKITNC